MRNVLTAALFASALLTGCAGPVAERPGTTPPLAELKGDEGQAGSWLLSELFAPGGTPKGASKARSAAERLAGKQGDPTEERALAHLALAMDDDLHGRLAAAADAYLSAAKDAREVGGDVAELTAWIAIDRAAELDGLSTKLYERWEKFIDSAIASPKGIGWRARAELVDWWSREAWGRAVRDLPEKTATRHGCLPEVALAGPFGRGTTADVVRPFPAEVPGPWPVTWSPALGRAVRPRVLPSRRVGCSVRTDTPVLRGVFYAQSFVNVTAPQDALLVAQGALRMWVDDGLVLDRDPRRWGGWHRFGTAVHLEPGRHRILVKLTTASTSVRLMHLDGRPLDGVTSSTDDGPDYGVLPPRQLGDPNVISRRIAGGVNAIPPDPVLRPLLAIAALEEDQGDVAAKLLEPFVKEVGQATGPALVLAARAVDDDPIFSDTQRSDLNLALYRPAAEKDPKLWEPQLGLALWEKSRNGEVAGIAALRKAAKQFPGVPPIALALSSLYAGSHWTAEYRESLLALEKRFPNNPAVLSTVLPLYEAEGNHARAKEIIAKVERLDPDAELTLDRALERLDFATAIQELKRLAKRRPEQKHWAARIADVMVRAGNSAVTWKKLEEAVKKAPRDGMVRLALADAKYRKSGNLAVLREAIIAATAADANTSPLHAALDLLEGMTALEPYRLDGRQVIDDYEKQGDHMAGTAARVLDYSAVWVRADGSSEVLSHEVIRIQSKEAIGRFAEQRPLRGVVLNQRVIKKDGRVLEPEMVPGKPTLTFPHLEVGDYIETEHVVALEGSSLGRRYNGPRWFFREKDVAYARSEFVVISPKSRKLTMETTGDVPKPEVKDLGAATLRRWRVDQSPAAPEEPFSVPITEFLPSVAVGWGQSLEENLQRLADRSFPMTPVDPRIVAIARKIVRGVPDKRTHERARRLYRWVSDNIKKGDESDGRRVITSKEGNPWRAYLTLCRSLGIKTEYALARNRLTAPAKGPISRSTQFDGVAMRTLTEQGPVWLTLGNKYAPFGFIPSELRGVKAYVFGTGQPVATTTSTDGASDAITYRGTAKLRRDGSAAMNIALELSGQYAMVYRNGLAQIPESRIHAQLEGKLVARVLQGAQLVKHRIEQLDDLDDPLTIHLDLEVPVFASQIEGGLALPPPFMPRLSIYASLPSRQTPLLVNATLENAVDLTVELPPGSSVERKATTAHIERGEALVDVKDSVAAGKLRLRRRVLLPAGRIQPSEYADFAKFLRKGDGATRAPYPIKAGR